MTKTVVFDVNETMLDLRALDGQFAAAFGIDGVRSEWFAAVLRTALVDAILGRYHDFGTVGAAALDMVAHGRGVTLGEDRRAAILHTMRQLPAHKDVAPALSRLKAAGLRLAALTNSTALVARAQLEFAGLLDHFDAVLSADTAGALKPQAAVYRRAAADLDAQPRDLWLVAAHDWDVAGAMATGWLGALVTRPGMAANPLFPPPDLTVRNMTALADLLVQMAN